MEDQLQVFAGIGMGCISFGENELYEYELHEIIMKKLSILSSGNSKGSIVTLDICAEKKAKINQTSSSVHRMIKDMKFSASGRYIASLDIIGKLCIWYYNSGYLILQQDIKDPRLSSIAKMDWHPWNDFDIALCMGQGRIVLIWNILSKKVEAYSKISTFNHNNPVICFNKITAELLISAHRVGE